MGSMNHCVTNKNNFNDFDTDFNPSTTVLEFADGYKINALILGKGLAQILLYDFTGILRSVTLKNALYVSSFTRNIMSLRQAVRDRTQFDFNTIGQEQMRISRPKG